MDTTDRSFEPMDIDISSTSLNTSNISNKSHKNEEKNNIDPRNIYELNRVSSVEKLTVPLIHVNRFHANLKPNQRRNSYTKHCISFVILCFSILAYYFINIQCAEKFNTEKVNQMLVSNLYGQDVAIKNIIKALDDKAPYKLIVFYGSTGVGKTYTINIMLENLFNCSNVYHYTMPSFKSVYKHSLLTGLILCPFSVVVVDGLTIKDHNIKSYIEEIINKSKKLQKDINLFLIYNCISNDFESRCNNLFIKQLQDSLSDIDATKFYIKFNTLSEEELIKCIQNEIKKLNRDDNSIEKLQNKFNVTLDGCKSVHSKLQTQKFKNL